jgi:hypothetical protein
MEVNSHNVGASHNSIDASWPAIVDRIFSTIQLRERLAMKRKARGRHKRKVARRARKLRTRGANE